MFDELKGEKLRRWIYTRVSMSKQFQIKKGEEIYTLSFLVEKVYAQYGIVSMCTVSHQGMTKWAAASIINICR